MGEYIQQYREEQAGKCVPFKGVMIELLICIHEVFLPLLTGISRPCPLDKHEDTPSFLLDTWPLTEELLFGFMPENPPKQTQLRVNFCTRVCTLRNQTP